MVEWDGWMDGLLRTIARTRSIGCTRSRGSRIVMARAFWSFQVHDAVRVPCTVLYYYTSMLSFEAADIPCANVIQK
jgi:hypothetical protein